MNFSTRAVHVGSEPDAATGAVIPPISLSTTFIQSAPGQHKGFEYSRSQNPSRAAFERVIASLENAKFALAFSSGSAVTSAVLCSLPANSNILSCNDVYGGTYRYFTKMAPLSGHKVKFLDMSSDGWQDRIKAELTSAKVSLIWIESPTNPTLRLCDIKGISALAHSHNCLVMADNTFMSPFFQNPLNLGADMVMHSVTKYINGHSDAVMGIVCTNSADLNDKIKFVQNSVGAVPSAFDCYLAQRGVKTLALRMQQHQLNALKVAKFLESHAGVERVIYPGLASHPQHKLATEQASGFGGMMSFYLRGTIETSTKFLQSVKLFTLAESLGGVESLLELPCQMTHGAVSPEERAKLGISDTLVRLSCGIEDGDDLVADLSQALDLCRK